MTIFEPCEDCEVTYGHEACVVCLSCGRHAERGNADLCAKCLKQPAQPDTTTVHPVSQTAPKSIPSPVPTRAVVWDMGGTKKGEDMTEETINLDSLSDVELLALATTRQRAKDAALEAWREAEAAVFQRMMIRDAAMMRAGDYVAEKKATRTYRWDAEAVAAIAPQFCDYYPSEMKPGYYKVSKTGGLNRYIEKLGQTPEAEALLQARQVEERWTLDLQVADHDREARIAEMVGRLEGGLQ